MLNSKKMFLAFALVASPFASEYAAAHDRSGDKQEMLKEQRAAEQRRAAQQAAQAQEAQRRADEQERVDNSVLQQVVKYEAAQKKLKTISKQEQKLKWALYDKLRKAYDSNPYASQEEVAQKIEAIKEALITEILESSENTDDLSGLENLANAINEIALDEAIDKIIEKISKKKLGKKWSFISAVMSPSDTAVSSMFSLEEQALLKKTVKEILGEARERLEDEKERAASNAQAVLKHWEDVIQVQSRIDERFGEGVVDLKRMALDIRSRSHQENDALMKGLAGRSIAGATQSSKEHSAGGGYDRGERSGGGDHGSAKGVGGMRERGDTIGCAHC